MDVLVSAQWLMDRMRAGGVVVLDATLPPVGVVPKVGYAGRGTWNSTCRERCFSTSMR